MPAVIVDDKPEDENLGDTTAERDTTLDDPAPAPAPPQKEEEASVPDKFKGKTQAEIIAAYHDLEKVAGRQGDELGQLRSTHDQYIKTALEAAQRQPAKPEVQETQDNDAEFFINPKAAIEKAVANHPLIKEVQSRQQKSQQERAAEAFDAKHPDSQEIVADPEFRAWIDSVPSRRTRLLAANTNYDFDTADELFSTYKEIKAAKTAATPAPAPPSKDNEAIAAAKTAALKAGTVPGGNASPAGLTVGKIYRRSDLARLRNENPDKYHEMGDEILLAYKEGRVK